MKKTRISRRKWIILPIETELRELQGKLLLACFAAEKGWGVVVGSKRATQRNKDLLPRGTFLEKSLAGIGSIISAGHRVSAWHEEGLVYVDTVDYSRRLIPGTFDLLDYYFAWGKKEADDAFEILGRGKEKIVVSGNPRFDLLRPEFRPIFYPAAEKLKELHGKIILINTKFVTLNSANPKARRDPVGYLKSVGRIVNEEQAQLFDRIIEFQKKVFPRFLELASLLSKEFKNHTIIIRPHPSETDTPWIESAKGLPNVKVIHEGNVNEWILASDVVIHSNCTTAIESFILDKPAIAFRPYKDERAEFSLPNDLSFQASNERELVNLAKYLVENKNGYKDDSYYKKHAEQLNTAKGYIANIEGKSACETIVDTLDKLEMPLSEGNFPIMRGGATKYFLRKIRSFISKGTRKFPGVGLNKVKIVLDDFKRVSNRFHNINVIQADEDGFCLYKDR